LNEHTDARLFTNYPETAEKLWQEKAEPGTDKQVEVYNIDKKHSR